jgi:hypothetical protein
MHLAQGRLSINDVAQSESNRDGIDAAIHLVKLGHVSQPKFDRRLEPPGLAQHRRRKIDADHTASWADVRQELVGHFSSPATQVEGGLAGFEPGAAGRAPSPGGVTVETEEPVADVVSGRDLIEHLANSLDPRWLPHTPIILFPWQS